MTDFWLPVALVTAFSSATGDTIVKAKFSHFSSGDMSIVRVMSPLPFLIPILLYIPWPETDAVFWQTIIIVLPFEILALLLYMKAIKSSPLSLTIPFLAFTPMFIVLTGWLVLGERLSLEGILGISLTVTGAYILNFSQTTFGLLAPFKAIFREKGSRLMLMVAAIYSLTSVLGKKAIIHSEPVFFACFYLVILGVLTPLAIFFRTKLSGDKRSVFAFLKHKDKGMWKGFWGVGLAQAVMVLTHMWAISLAPAAYMIAVKRTSLLFSVFYGKIIFKETETLQRMLGAVIMLLGVAVIAYQ